MKRIQEHGFTVIEVVIALVIIILVLVVAVPAISIVREDAEADRILGTIKQAQRACQRHYQDCGLYGREDTEAYDATWRRLSLKQKLSGWNGPYLDESQSVKINPFGGRVVVYPDLAGGVHRPFQSEFRLTGPSASRRRGQGNFVAFEQVPRNVAEIVDKSLDDGVPGSWNRYGRVQWKKSNGGTLMVFLMQK